MSGQKFQYDESGGTFFYFLFSFLALILIPGTFYLWPRRPKPAGEFFFFFISFLLHLQTHDHLELEQKQFYK